MSRRAFVAAGFLLSNQFIFSKNAITQDYIPKRYCISRGVVHKLSDLTPVDDYKLKTISLMLSPHVELRKEFFGSMTPILIAHALDDAYFDGDHDHIVLGSSFIDRIANEPPGMTRLAGVVAHEESHRFQVAKNIDRFLKEANGSVTYIELHADYMAGCYMYWCSKRRSIFARQASDMFFNLGDFRKERLDHHGTNTERWFAFRQGFSDFENRLKDMPHSKAADAASAGIKYISRLQK